MNEPKKYTGHCFRRTAATLLSESGGQLQQIEELGRWRSDAIAQGYIEKSTLNRQLIFDGVVRNNKTFSYASELSTHRLPSTITKEVRTYQPKNKPSTITKKVPTYQPESGPSTRTEIIPMHELEDVDFSEGFTYEDIIPKPSKHKI